MLEELFGTVLRTAGLADEQKTTLAEFLKTGEGELPAEIKTKLESANKVLTSKEFLRNDPDFLESIKNDRLGKTLGEIDEKNKGSWLETFDTFLTPEDVDSIYGNQEFKYSSTKERKLKEALKAKITGKLSELEAALEEAKKGAGQDGNETIEKQSQRIKELEAAIAAKEEEFQTQLSGVEQKYRLKEVNQLVQDRIGAVKTKLGRFVSDAPGYLSSLERNAFSDLNTQYVIRANDKLELELYQKDNPELRAVDPETKTTLAFDQVLDAWLNEYGAIPKNAGGGNTPPAGNPPGTPPETPPAGGGDLPKGVHPDSDAARRYRRFQKYQK